jgi:hypothetical protein
LFCAKCGSGLTEHERGWFVCPNGLQFSLHLSRLLRERYPVSSGAEPTKREPPEPFTWFCPGCGGTLAGAELDCRSCKISLGPLVHDLVEHHPHPDGRGAYY